jgi:hypothetical protein
MATLICLSTILNANVLLNPAFPKREGTNVNGQKAVAKLLVRSDSRRHGMRSSRYMSGSLSTDLWPSSKKTFQSASVNAA